MSTNTDRLARGGLASAELDARIRHARRLRSQVVAHLARRLATRIHQSLTTRRIEPFLWTARR